MKKQFVLLFLLAFAFFSQLNAQQIEMKKAFGGYTFHQNGGMLSVGQMQELMKENDAAFKLMRSAKGNQILSMVLGGAGGALVGFPIGTAIGGGEPEWALAGVGAALIVATIPIAKGFTKKAKKAVELYNANQSTVGSSFIPEFNLNVKGMSMGISMTF
ncbi:hypothetical protein [Polaribacter tangerinus]|uniref:hypothetical protein n=1 Tax=Polaribacter tangerinus TaxID=1920034 RepID=UPI000B4A83BE|nr:hypothetical protein [Polaribacter tangerinus]